MSRFLAVLLVALAVALAGCTEPQTRAPADAPPATEDGDEVAVDAANLSRASTFVATDFAFEGPRHLPSGWNELSLRNDGGQIHHMYLTRLDGGTYEEWRAALADDNATDPEVTQFGGPNAVEPGDTQTAHVFLEPGEYVAVCWIPDPQGTPHAFHGMHVPVTVVEAEEEGEAPESEVWLAFQDFAFHLSDNLTAGAQTLEVVNDGNYPHEVAVIRLEGNATAFDYVAAFGPNATAPPPGHGAGGITAIEPGANAYVELDLPPGRYALLCFEAEGTEGPHFAHGMVLEFEVG